MILVDQMEIADNVLFACFNFIVKICFHNFFCRFNGTYQASWYAIWAGAWWSKLFHTFATGGYFKSSVFKNFRNTSLILPFVSYKNITGTRVRKHCVQQVKWWPFQQKYSISYSYFSQFSCAFQSKERGQVMMNTNDYYYVLLFIAGSFSTWSNHYIG